MNILTKLIVAVLVNVMGSIEETQPARESLIAEHSFINCSEETISINKNHYLMLKFNCSN